MTEFDHKGPDNIRECINGCSIGSPVDGIIYVVGPIVALLQTKLFTPFSRTPLTSNSKLKSTVVGDGLAMQRCGQVALLLTLFISFYPK